VTAGYYFPDQKRVDQVNSSIFFMIGRSWDLQFEYECKKQRKHSRGQMQAATARLYGQVGAGIAPPKYSSKHRPLNALN